ncbi:ycfA-like protein domain-containing protein [Pochonia chlamydosporia 170]|uniref:YcfA-like protein domain-containing protein n=1 Tax=Pochonia chlamydosporia 170 TaxID=1380566 RepID=A0A179F8T6_METCM|nr:ycfA-like protein domain-containing protein [Pochonia chlamydosporia 170]OAQ61914.2 ycfA-like protein domain-containing protein [Pochonia chlamydosporia 170]
MKFILDGQYMLLALFYNKPAPNGPKGLARLNESRSQRKAIEKFWEMMRKILKEGCHDYSHSNENTRKWLAALSLHLTPEYAEAVRQEESSFTLLTETEPSRSRFAYSEVCSPNKSKCIVEVVTTSNKIKTRGTASEELESATENGDTTEILAVKRRPVAKHDLEIFCLIFPESAEERCRTVSWDEFVQAMKHAGCVAINCGGSAVRFELQDTSDEATSESKSIIFHRPHPVPKIDPIMLRSEIGRRLTRRFGWTREHFVLAGVDETAEKPVPTADDK